MYKNSVPLLNCLAERITALNFVVGISKFKIRCGEMQVFFQSVEVLSKGCQNITTLSFSVISGVITLTNLLNNNDF